MGGGDERAGVIDVRAVVAGGHKGRRADPHVDLLRPGFPQQVDGPAAGGAPDDGVVDQYHALAADGGGDGVELDVDGFLPLALLRLDKGAGDILVFDDAYAVRDAGLRLDIEAPSPGAPSMTAALDLFLKEQSKKK